MGLCFLLVYLLNKVTIPVIPRRDRQCQRELVYIYDWLLFSNWREKSVQSKKSVPYFATVQFVYSHLMLNEWLENPCAVFISEFTM